MAVRRKIPPRPGGGQDGANAAARMDGRRKVTVLLPAGLADQLAHEAVHLRTDLGGVIAPLLRRQLGNRWTPHRRDADAPVDQHAVRIARPADTEAPAAEGAAPEAGDAA